MSICSPSSLWIGRKGRSSHLRPSFHSVLSRFQYELPSLIPSGLGAVTAPLFLAWGYGTTLLISSNAAGAFVNSPLIKLFYSYSA